MKNRLSYWLGTYWVEFDFVYMKPRLVHNWPHVKDDNDNIAKRIKEAMKQYKEEIKQPESSTLIDALQNLRNAPEEDQVIHSVDDRANNSPSNDKSNIFQGLTVKHN